MRLEALCSEVLGDEIYSLLHLTKKDKVVNLKRRAKVITSYILELNSVKIAIFLVRGEIDKADFATLLSFKAIEPCEQRSRAGP